MEEQGFSPSGAHSLLGSQCENKKLSLGEQHKTRQAYRGRDGERNASLSPGPGKTSHILPESEGSVRIQ